MPVNHLHLQRGILVQPGCNAHQRRPQHLPEAQDAEAAAAVQQPEGRKQRIGQRGRGKQGGLRGNQEGGVDPRGVATASISIRWLGSGPESLVAWLVVGPGLEVPDHIGRGGPDGPEAPADVSQVCPEVRSGVENHTAQLLEQLPLPVIASGGQQR